jgi:hypothetical protein
VNARGALIVVFAARAAAAEPYVDLQLAREPAPRHLHMRAKRRVVAAAAPEPPPAAVAAPLPPSDSEPYLSYVRDVREPVSVRFSLGYQVDGSTLTGQPTLGGNVPRDAVHSNRPDIDLVHAYGFGEVYLSTRGMGTESLSAYFASHFQLSQQTVVHDPTNPYANASGNVVAAPALLTWFDRSGITAQDVWAEVKAFLPWKELDPLRVRAGEQYVYGPWVLHMYGVQASWDGKLLRATAYGGSRVPDYTLAVADQELDRAGIAGVSVRADLRALLTPAPFVLAVEGLTFTRLGSTDTQPSSHAVLEADWLPREGLAVIGQARSLDGEWANEHVQLRARYHQVTNIVVDVTHHHENDWRWDPSLVGPQTNDPLAPKRYLDLGPVVPQLLVSARAGTLIAENVDLYGRVAASDDLRTNIASDSSFGASYVEGGGALEVRLRRTLALGISGLTRRTRRYDDLAHRIQDVPGMADPLPLAASTGERGFVEAGATLRMTLGARKFSALVEIYGRDTDYARVYCVGTKCQSDNDTGVKQSDVRGGGRFTVDAWIGRRVRMFASYDLSSSLPLAPELTGYKSLRLIMEGVY